MRRSPPTKIRNKGGSLEDMSEVTGSYSGNAFINSSNSAHRFRPLGKPICEAESFRHYRIDVGRRAPAVTSEHRADERADGAAPSLSRGAQIGGSDLAKGTELSLLRRTDDETLVCARSECVIAAKPGHGGRPSLCEQRLMQGCEHRVVRVWDGPP
jgi:hypothetical protein